MSIEPYNRIPYRRNVWQDWANLLISIWFFFSPWILGFGSAAATPQPAGGAAPIYPATVAAWNAWVLAVIVFVVTLSAIGRMEFWQERVNVVLGAWIFAAPWALGFATGPLPAARWDHWVVGALIFLIALSALFTNPPTNLPLERR